MKEQKRFTLLWWGRACRYIKDVPVEEGPPVVEIELQDTGHRKLVARKDVMAPNGEEFRGPDV